MRSSASSPVRVVERTIRDWPLRYGANMGSGVGATAGS